MASKNGSLSDIPDGFGISYLKTTLSSSKKQKAQAFVSGCYVEKLINKKRKPVMANNDDNRKISVTNDHLVALKSLSASPISYLVEEITSETLHVETPIGQQVLGSGLSYHAHLLEPVYHLREEFGCGDIHLPADTEAFLAKHSDNWNDVSVTEEESRALENSTRLQSSSAEWHAQRKKRITVSKF